MERVAPLVRLAAGLASAAGFEVLLVRLRVAGLVSASAVVASVFVRAAGFVPAPDLEPLRVRVEDFADGFALCCVVLERLAVVLAADADREVLLERLRAVLWGVGSGDAAFLRASGRGASQGTVTAVI